MQYNYQSLFCKYGKYLYISFLLAPFFLIIILSFSIYTSYLWYNGLTSLSAKVVALLCLCVNLISLFPFCLLTYRKPVFPLYLLAFSLKFSFYATSFTLNFPFRKHQKCDFFLSASFVLQHDITVIIPFWILFLL